MYEDLTKINTIDEDLAKKDIFWNLREELGKTVEEWEIFQNESVEEEKKFEEKFSSIEKGRRQYNDLTLDQVQNKEGDIFKRLLRKLISERKETNQPEVSELL